MADTNIRYELIGGILYHTPVDETNALIESEYFKKAKRIADLLLAVRKAKLVRGILDRATPEIIHYMNSPLVDFLYEYRMDSWVRKAAQLGNVQALQYLHCRGINRNDYTPAIRDAAMHGHLNVIEFLHQCGTELHTHKYEALSNACQYGHLDIVKYLVKNGAKIDDGRNHYGYTSPLHYAVKHNYTPIIKYLLENGAKITGSIVLEAFWNVNPDIIKLLVEHGTVLGSYYISVVKERGYIELYDYIMARQV